MNKFTPITLFLTITLTLSALFYYLIINSGSLTIPSVFGLMWCPGVATIITLKLLKINFSELGWKWGKTKYQIWSFIIPFLLVLITYIIVWGFDMVKFTNHKFITVLMTVIINFGIGLVFSLGEEIGWRGFLTPKLYEKFGFTKTAIVSGLIWGVWHLPLVLFADYNDGSNAPTWYLVCNFMVNIISVSFVFTWFRIKSENLWTAVILHTSWNLFSQEIFPLFFKGTKNSFYYVGEFGIILPILTTFLAIYFWKKQVKLNHSLKINP